MPSQWELLHEFTRSAAHLQRGFTMEPALMLPFVPVCFPEREEEAAVHRTYAYPTHKTETHLYTQLHVSLSQRADVSSRFLCFLTATIHAPHPCIGAAGAPEQWKWTFCHRLSLRCQTRVSSDWLERGRPCPSTNCVRRM